MPIIKLVSRNNSIFLNRSTQIMGFDKNSYSYSKISIPNNLIVCDVCNILLLTKKIMLLFLSKKDKYPYGTLCPLCKKRHWDKVKVIPFGLKMKTKVIY